MNTSLAIDNSRLPLPRISPILAGALLIAAAFWPVWRWYALRLNDGSDEPFGLIALGVAGWILWQHRGRLAITPDGTSIACLLVICYVITFPFLPALVRALVAMVVIGAFIGIHRAPYAVWGLLALSLPVIPTAQFFAGWPLRVATATGSEFLLNLAGLEVIREGTVLWWKEATVAVDPPCSGIRMLWAGMFVHFALAAIHGLRFRTLLWLTPLAFAGVLLANVIRASLLFFKESGAVTLPEWTHVGIGLAVFGLLLAGMALFYPRLPRSTETAEKPIPKWRMRPSAFGMLAVLASFAALSPFSQGQHHDDATTRSREFPGWPADFEGESLQQLPLSKQEAAFAKDFPGELGVFVTESGRKVILRWVTRATRKLHSSADCLRATGFTLDPDKNPTSDWARWGVHHPDHGSFHAREQIREAGLGSDRSWTEPSAWFWPASVGRTTGPWWAVTVLEPKSTPLHR